MKAKRIVKVSILFSVLCLMALQCGNPNLPHFVIITPSENAVLVQDSVPYSLPVAVKVALPGCGATTYPVDPATFAAQLTLLQDGAVISQTDVTSSFQLSQDPTTKADTWTANLDLESFGDYQIQFTAQNSQGSGTITLSFTLEQTVALYPGGTNLVSISSLTQTPANCMISDLLLGVIYGLIKNEQFPLTLPSGQDILDSGNAYAISIPLPAPLGNLDVTLALDEPNNDIVITGPSSYTIDLTGLVPPPFTGFDCVITASANGVIDHLVPADLDGSLTIGVLDIQASPSGSGCTLTPPSGSCDLNAGLEATPM